MKQILVLGAGESAQYLIHHLLGDAEELDSFVTVSTAGVGPDSPRNRPVADETTRRRPPDTGLDVPSSNR